MRRVALTSLVACVFAVLPGAFALGARAPQRSDARARLTACKPALDQASRSLTVDASMRSLQKGDHMQLRFELFRKAQGSRRFRKLAGPGLGTWNPATPGVDRFRFRKPIQNLPAASTYYVKVTYRWLNEQNLAYDEIAEAVQRPIGTVKTWLHRARAELAEHLTRRGVHC